ncbi:hypothetical protein [Microcoleus sp. B4-D4]
MGSGRHWYTPKSTLDPEINAWRYYDRHREQIDRIIVSHQTDD